MALYYPNFQRDSLPTSYVGEQKIVFFPEQHLHPGNMTMYLNQTSSAGSFSEILSASSLSPRNCVGIASVGGRNEMVFIPPTSDTVTLQSINGQLNSTPGIMGSSLSGDSEVIPRTQPSILDGEQNFGCQGLSLSLGTQLPSAISVPSLQYQYQTLAYPSSGAHLPVSGKGSGNGDETEKNEELRNSGHMPSGFKGGNYETVQKEAFWNLQCSVNQKEMHSDICQYDPAGFANTILHSRYLKAAQQLLDEVVNLRKTLKQPDPNKRQRIHGIGSDDPKGTDGKSTCHSMNQMSSDHNESASNSSELSPSERQVLQNKKAKLMSMLDEVDKRYKQYYHQMQVVVSSFEMVTGSGAAKTYTALALQTISRHFRCLRDVISDQIRVSQRRLGEQDTSQLDEAERIPRLRFVDHQLRQQKALQQLGVMRPAWRPQRGLPESSVSILRAWLFEHFLHPYPKDSEKLMLAKQTGLNKNQVANWFINARVRLWKPMIEDMYKEEFGDSEMNSKSSQGNAHKMEKENSTASEVKGEEFQDSMTSSAADPDVMYPGHAHDLKSNHFSDVEINRPSVIQSGAYANNISISSVMNLPGDQRHGTDGHGLNLDEMMPGNPSSKSSLMTSAAASYISELDGFTVGSQVSLALGLQQRHDTNLFSMSGGDIRGNQADSSSTRSDMVDYHCMDLGNQQDRFSNAHQLHDFVV